MPNKRNHPAWLAALMALTALTAYAPLAVAETLRDPTRPPNYQSVATAGSAVTVTPAGPVLQSILIAPGRKVAVISGQQVTLGSQYGDARVVQLTDTTVTLQRGTEMRVLKLFSGIEKQFAGSSQTQWPPQVKVQRQ